MATYVAAREFAQRKAASPLGKGEAAHIELIEIEVCFGAQPDGKA